jgi:class 3 adenylate cyclase
MAERVSRTVTFLFTDMEGSTRLLKALGRDRYREVLGQHQRLLRDAFAAHGGKEVDTQGDSFLVAFESAADAAAAAVDAQRALAEHEWPEEALVRVRMGLHTTEASFGEERYVGLGLHRAARVGAAAHGGQVLLTSATRELVEDDLPADATLRDLGAHRVKDIEQPVRIYQLIGHGLQRQFPRLRTVERARPYRRRGLLAGALAGVIAAAVAIPIFAFGGGGSSGGGLSEVEANSVGVIDAGRSKITTRSQ